MRHHFLLFLLLLLSLPMTAQTAKGKFQIVGQAVSKADNKGIPYVTLTLQNDSAKLLNRLSSDANGKFTVPLPKEGKYMLILTATGFQEITQTVNAVDAKTDLGILSMEEGVAMKAVTVTAQKPLVRVDADKITYSVEADPDAQTNNGLEILRKVPLLAVDGEENITLNGQSNYKVLVNGKSSSMMSKNFKEVIKSMPANSIKDIEIITNPSTKYEAEGVGGIINIITFKKTLNGYNGSVNMGCDSWGSMNGSIYLSTKINKFGFSGRYNLNQFNRPPSEYTSTSENANSEVYHTTMSHSTGNNSGYSQNFSGEMSYDIDTFNLISASFWGYGSNVSNNSNSTNRVTDVNDVLSQYFETENNGHYNYGSVSGNIDYQKTYMKPDKSLTASYKFDMNPENTNSTSDIDSVFNYTAYLQKTIRKELGQEHTFQIDYYDPVSKMHQFECGLKYIYRNNDEDAERWKDGVLRTDYSNRLLYDQTILGAYAGYVFKLKKLTAKSGFRIERTWNYGKSISDSTVKFTNKLFNLVPYISFAYQFKPGQTLKLGYTQRLQRPSVYYLNPYVENSNPLYIRYGNTDLKSELSHSFELGYSIFDKGFTWNSSLNASINNNSIENVSSIDSMGVTTTTYDNIGLDQRLGWNNYISYRKGTKFNIYASLNGAYSRFAANNGLDLSNAGFSFRCNGGMRVSLWKDASLNGNLGYSSPSVYLQGRNPGYTYSSMGFSQYFLKRKMQLNLSVSDPLTERRFREGDQKGVGYTTHYEYWYYTRTARLTLSYNFGKLDTAVKKAKRGISNDDVKSGGGSAE
jgi:hypothetical protein